MRVREGCWLQIVMQRSSIRYSQLFKKIQWQYSGKAQGISCFLVYNFLFQNFLHWEMYYLYGQNQVTKITEYIPQ